MGLFNLTFSASSHAWNNLCDRVPGGVRETASRFVADGVVYRWYEGLIIVECTTATSYIVTFRLLFGVDGLLRNEYSDLI